MKKLVILAAGIFALSATSGFSAEAKENWDNLCAKCHGADGKGQTKMGQKLEVRDYTNADVKASIKDEDAFKAIKEGVNNKEGKQVMKAFNTLTDDEIKALVAFVKAL